MSKSKCEERNDRIEFIQMKTAIKQTKHYAKRTQTFSFAIAHVMTYDDDRVRLNLMEEILLNIYSYKRSVEYTFRTCR